MDENVFFGLLLMYLRFVAVDSIKKISTDGKCIFFSPAFLEKLSESETDYVLCHQLMHILSGDIARPCELEGDNYHFACDIVINREMSQCGFPLERYTHLGSVKQELPGSIDTSGMSRMEIYDLIPFNLYSLPDNERSRFLIDNDDFWNHEESVPVDGEIILDLDSDDGLIDEEKNSKKDKKSSGGSSKESGADWHARAVLAAKAEKESECEKTAGISNLPQSVRELIKVEKPMINWRKILNDFLQEEICDYSFSPPDRRFDDFDFFLPDFNEKDFTVKKILFMIDTSGSMNIREISEAFAEIRGAAEQFNGKLAGSLGFFDDRVVPPIPFDGIKELEKIVPKGGGGTDFGIIFDYIFNNKWVKNLPDCLIIMTDGYADYPDESAAHSIPVLWLINNTYATPPWGQVARFVSEQSFYD